MNLIRNLLSRLGNIPIKPNQTQYPSRLLPKRSYKIIPPNRIDNRHILLRRVEDLDLELRDADNKLNPKAVNTKEFPGFSTNKNPKSKTEDLRIIFKDDFKKAYTSAWVEGSKVSKPPPNTFFIKEVQFFSFTIGAINGFSQEVNDLNSKPVVVHKFTISIVHRPLNANYWHFEFEIDANGKPMKKLGEKPAWHKTVASIILDQLLEIA